MAEIKSFKDLIVWQKSMKLAGEAYRIGALMPKTEQFRMTSQLLRAATSVPANIAEGHARGTRREFAHFVRIARGSLAETQTLLQLSVDVSLIRAEEVATASGLAMEVGRRLTTQLDRLRSPSPGTSPPLS